MPTKIIDAEGNEIEALTAEEVAELEERAKKAQEYEQKVAELQKQLEEEGNPNWRAVREKMNKLKEFIKEKGFELKDDGTVIDSNSVIDPNKIKEDLKKELKVEQFNEIKDELLDEYDESTRNLISVYIEKLMAGEEMNNKNLKKGNL